MEPFWKEIGEAVGRKPGGGSDDSLFRTGYKHTEVIERDA